MKVAITSADGFVAPYISEMLGESGVIIPDDTLADSSTLDSILTPCTSLIHINSRPVDTSVARDDRGVGDWEGEGVGRGGRKEGENEGENDNRFESIQPNAVYFQLIRLSY